VFVTFYLGQLSVLVTVLVLAALYAQGHGRSGWAGAFLALATLKVGTMLPFLLLFLRRRDGWFWAALVVVSLGLCLASGHLADLPGLFRTGMDRVAQLEGPGIVNDYSFEGPRPENLLGFDRALYCLGMRDRGAIRVVQFVILLALGGWVAWEVVPGRRMP